MQNFYFQSKDKKYYANIYQSIYRFIEINMAEYMLAKGFIQEHEVKKSLNFCLSKVDKSITDFLPYSIKLMLVSGKSLKKNNVWYEENYTIADVKNGFLEFKEFIHHLSIIKNWLNDNLKLLSTITIEEVMPYCHSEVFIKNYLKHHETEKQKDKALNHLMNSTIREIYDFKNIFVKNYLDYLESSIAAWNSFFNNENEPYHLIEENNIEQFYQKKNYALYHYDGNHYGFLKNSTGFVADISEAKLFSNEIDAKKYIKKNSLSAAIVQVNLEFNQIIDNSSNIDVSALVAVASFIEKKHLEKQSTKQSLIEQLLPLLDGEEEIQGMLKKHLDVKALSVKKQKL